MNLTHLTRDCLNLLKYGKDAPLTRQRIFVDPAEITTIVQPHEIFRRHDTAKVVGGDWDVNVAPLAEEKMYKTVCGRFVEGLSWEESYKKYRDITAHTPERGFVWDAMYHCLKSGGTFKTREELGGTKWNRERGGVCIHIDRNCNPVFGCDGFHRLVIAQILGIKCIPAKIGVVHAEAVKNGRWRVFIKTDITKPEKNKAKKPKRPAVLRKRYWVLDKILRPHLMRSLYEKRCWRAQFSDGLKGVFNPDDFPLKNAPSVARATYWKGAITNNPSRILELGSYQGGSAVMWAHLFPEAHITCVDAWTEYAEMQNLSKAEVIFDGVTKAFANRLRKIKSDTFSALANLINEDDKFSLIYIDAGHFEDNVLIDTWLSWRLLAVDGLIVWDDYAHKKTMYTGRQPRHAIDHFLNRHVGQYKFVSVYPQVIIQKTIQRD